jgi:hypothetical protein
MIDLTARRVIYLRPGRRVDDEWRSRVAALKRTMELSHRRSHPGPTRCGQMANNITCQNGSQTAYRRRLTHHASLTFALVLVYKKNRLGVDRKEPLNLSGTVRRRPAMFTEPERTQWRSGTQVEESTGAMRVQLRLRAGVTAAIDLSF